MRDVANLEMEVLDILLMDKGTGTFTSYDFTGDVSDHLMNKMMADPENWGNAKIGHIHSHNTMGVFFSGTDTSELQDNCHFHSFYLSLIVNNFMDMCAKVAFKTTYMPPAPITSICYDATDEAGETYQLCIEQEAPEQKMQEVMFTYDCDIQIPEKEITVEEEFSNRLGFILTKPEREKEERERLAKEKQAELVRNPTPQPRPGSAGSGNPWENPALKWNPILKEYEPVTVEDQKALPAGRVPFEDQFEEHETIDVADFADMTTMTEFFTAYVLRFGQAVISNLEFADEDIDFAKIITESDQSKEAYVKHLISNYGQYYNSFFQDEISRNELVMEDFLDTTESVIENLQTIPESEYKVVPEVPMLIDELKQLCFDVQNAWEEKAGLIGLPKMEEEANV